MSLSVLIFGAQDTTSSALSRILYMLSRNSEVQDKLRQEIRQAYSSSGNWSRNGTADYDGEGGEVGEMRLKFDVVDALPWLDAVVRETLRL